MEPSAHRHCKVCGRVCAEDRETCSTACQDRRERILRTRRTYTYVLYGLILLILLVFVLPYLGVR